MTTTLLHSRAGTARGGRRRQRSDIVKAAVGVLTVALLGHVIVAQSPRAFDVASVKRNTTNGAGLPPIVAISGDTVTAPFITLREVIRVAYGVYDNQVVGGPGWVESERFEIGARLPAGTSLEAVREMLRTLLAERFGLIAHQDKRELPVYTLTSTGPRGPQLRPAGPQCAALKSPAGIPAPPPPPPPPAGTGPMTVLGQPPGSKCGTVVMRGFVSARDIPLETFAYILMRELQRPVFDRTALTGRYDIDLSFLPDGGPMVINGQAINGDAPSLATAVREQLGLKLDATRAPVDVIVIDRVNLPTEN